MRLPRLRLHFAFGLALSTCALATSPAHADEPESTPLETQAPIAPAAVPASIPALEPNTVTVVLEQPGFVLEQQVGVAWLPLCESPCERVVPVDRYHRITRPGMQTSPGFRPIGKPGDRIVLDVDPGTTAALGAGIALVTVGAVATYIGYAALPVQFFTDDTHWPLPTMVIGLGATLGGAIILQSNIKTRVGQVPHVAERGAPVDHPSVRVRDISLPKARTATVFSIRF